MFLYIFVNRALARKSVLVQSELYNRQLKEALELEEKGKVLIVAPDGYFKGGSLAKDKNQIMQIYEEGYEKARMISDFIYFFNPSGALER